MLEVEQGATTRTPLHPPPVKRGGDGNPHLPSMMRGVTKAPLAAMQVPPLTARALVPTAWVPARSGRDGGEEWEMRKSPNALSPFMDHGNISQNQP